MGLRGGSDGSPAADAGPPSAENRIVGRGRRRGTALAALVVAIAAGVFVATRSTDDPELADTPAATSASVATTHDSRNSLTSRPVSSDALAELGLGGHLFAWNLTGIFRLDLTSGEWTHLPPVLRFADPLIRRMAPTPTGFVISGNDSSISLDIDGNELDRINAPAFHAGFALARDRLWIISESNEASLRLTSLDSSGRWEEGPSVPIGAATSLNTTRIAGVGERLLISATSGGVFDLLAGGERIGDGVVLADGDGGVAILSCSQELSSCEAQIRAEANLEVVARLDGVQGTGGLFRLGPPRWSPDLGYLYESTTGASIRNTQTGDLVSIPVRNADRSVPSWTAGSEYLMTAQDGEVRFYDPETGAFIAIAAPEQAGPNWSATLLHRP